MDYIVKILHNYVGLLECYKDIIKFCFCFYPFGHSFYCDTFECQMIAEEREDNLHNTDL